MSHNLNQRPMKSFKIHVKLDQLLVHIGKTALHGLLQDSKLIFKDDEFGSSEIIEQGCLLGIMSKDSKVSGFDKITYISFVHKTFQEYCSALYLSSVADSKNQVLFKSYLSQMNIIEMEYVLRFSCGTNQKAAEYILTYLVDVVKIETQNDPTNSSILKQICTLPLVLLFEAESKFGVIASLHTILSPAIVDIKMEIHVDHDDPSYKAALQYFIETFDTQKAWTERIQEASIYHHRSYSFNESDKFKTSIQVELLAKLSLLKKLKIVFLNDLHMSSYASFRFEYIKKLVYSLEELTLRRYTTSVSAVFEFLKKTSHNVRLHLDCLESDKDTGPEQLSYVLQAIHSTGGSIRKLEVNCCDVKQVIGHVTPFYSKLEGVTLMNAGLTNECVDTMCDGLIQTGHKINSRWIPCCENEDTAHCMVDQPCVCLPLRALNLSPNELSLSGNKLCATFPFLGCLKKLQLRSCRLMENDFQTLGPALSNLSNLQYLDLSENNIGNSLNKVIQGINHSKITHLYLQFTNLSKESKQNLSQLQLPLLEEITFTGNDINRCEAEALSMSLKHMPQLKKLNLWFNLIGSHGAIALFDSFQYTPHLENLVLNGNNIDFIALGSSFQCFPSLTRLEPES